MEGETVFLHRNRSLPQIKATATKISLGFGRQLENAF